jgi:CheY-like chemotaxis protein
MVLEWEGYRVTCAANGQEALDCLRGEDPPSVILLDLKMPVMDGFQLRQELKQDPALAAIPVVAVSGLRDAPGVDAAAWVQKPFEPKELLDAIRRVQQAV